MVVRMVDKSDHFCAQCVVAPFHRDVWRLERVNCYTSLSLYSVANGQSQTAESKL